MRTIFMALIVVFCSSASLWAANPAQPELVPDALQKGIDIKDPHSAMQHLELESIISGIFDETLPQINESVKNGEVILNPALAAVLGSFNSGNSVAKRTASVFLHSELEKFIIYGIESGAFAGNPLPEDERMMLDGGMFAHFGDISLERKEFSNTQILHSDDKTALIQTTLYDYGAKRAYTLKLWLELINDCWKVTRVVNAADLYKELLKKG